MAGQGFGLAGVQAFGLEKLIEARRDAIGHAMQNLSALGHRHLPPWSLQRSACRPDRGVDLGAAGLVHAADHLAIDRVDVLEGAAAGRIDEGTVNEMLDLFHLRNLCNKSNRTIRSARS